jgi:hypothetical protein
VQGSAPGEVIRAIELLGKYLGIFVDRKELSGPNGTPLSPPHLQVVFVDAETDDEEEG